MKNTILLLVLTRWLKLVHILHNNLQMWHFWCYLKEIRPNTLTVHIKVREVTRENLSLYSDADFKSLTVWDAGANFNRINLIYCGLKEAAQIHKKASPLLWFLAMHCLYVLVQFHVVAWNSCQFFFDSPYWWITSYLYCSASSTFIYANFVCVQLYDIHSQTWSQPPPYFSVAAKFVFSSPPMYTHFSCCFQSYPCFTPQRYSKWCFTVFHFSV